MITYNTFNIIAYNMQYNWVNNVIKQCEIYMRLMKVIHIRPTVFWPVRILIIQNGPNLEVHIMYI